MGIGTGTEPSLLEVYQARNRIDQHIFHPPMRRSDTLSELTGRDVWLMPESLQRTGAFKIRGALNRLLAHRDRCGGPVLTASSGNHAIGVTVAGKIARVETTVVVPETVSPSKLARLDALGAHVVIDGAGFDEAEARAFQRAETLGIELVNSFDPEVISGHATVALEMLGAVPDLEAIVTPVASGGLLAGCAVAARQLSPHCRLFGVQTENAPAMKASLGAAALVPADERPTIADGLAGNALKSELPFQIIRRHIEDIWLVSEASLYRAIWYGLTSEQLVLEGAGAATVAAVLEGHLPTGGGPVGIVLSGGNVAPDVLRNAVDQPA